MSGHIKIPSVQPYTQYIANGTQSAFQFLFPIFHSSDIAVFINDERKADDFAVSGAGDTEGGIVTFTVPPESGTKITLRRQLNCARLTDFQESGEFRAKAINDELDYLTALIQQVADENDRSIRISATDAIGNLTIPNSELRAGKAIGFDINGNVTVFHADLTEAIAWKTLDDIPDGVSNVKFSAVQREKLATIERGAQANATQISQTERSSGIERSLRSFSPHDVAEMVRSFAPAGSIASVFGRSGAVVAQLGDYTATLIANTPAGGIAATTVQAAINELDTEKAATGHNHDATYAPLAHVGAGTTAHAAATTIAAGFMSAADKAKLNTIADSATANPNAIETSAAGEIAALTEKVTPVSADLLLIEDSAAGNAKKKVQIGNLPGGVGGGLSGAQVQAIIADALGNWWGTSPANPSRTWVIAKEDGTSDRVNIQAALDALPATGGVCEIIGRALVDKVSGQGYALTRPANAASATGEATFVLAGAGYASIAAMGTQDFHIIEWSGVGIAQKINLAFRDLKIIGLWEEQADGAGKANSSYRGIKAQYANRVSVENCWVDNVRGFSISIANCTEANVAGCTVTRGGKDGISMTSCVISRAIDNTVDGCGDNCIAAHTATVTTGTIANANGTIQTTSGSATVAITFPASNSAVVGDKLVITGSGVVGGLNMRGTWTIATKPTGSTCTFTHDLTATATVGAGTPPGATFAFEVGSGWEESRQTVQILGNKIANGFGIKALGGPNVDISGNIIKTVHGTAIHVGGEGSGSEGLVDYRTLTIQNNQIADVIKKAYLGMSAPSDACILVDHRWSTIGMARIEGNTLNCNRPLRSGETKPSDWQRGYDPPNGGPASPQHAFFSANGWIDTAFSGEPTYQVIKGIEIRAENGLDRNAIRVKDNSFSGLVANQAVRRYAPINGGTRVRPTIANAGIANWETLLPAAGAYSLLNLDLAPAYGIGIRARKGAATATQPTVTLECRLRRNDGIGVDGYVATTWGGGTAFATAQAVCSSDNTDVTTAITALPADAKRSMDVVPFGATSVNGNPFELISLELIVDHADNDSDYVAALPGIYDPESLGVTLGFGFVSAATWASMTSGEKAGRSWVVT